MWGRRKKADPTKRRRSCSCHFRSTEQKERLLDEIENTRKKAKLQAIKEKGKGFNVGIKEIKDRERREFEI